MTYKIVRNYFDQSMEKETLQTGLTLAEARKHCEDPETSSKTCKTAENVRHTEDFGPWFDGYYEE